MTVLYRVVFLGLLCFYSALKANGLDVKKEDVIQNIQKIFLRKTDRMTNTTESGNEPITLRDPSTLSDDIISQIISLLNCGSFPLSANSHMQYSLDNVTKNLKVFQECDRHYKTNQSSESLQVQCKYKNWVFNKINCEINTCPRLTAPTGGHISTTENTYNTTVYFWCSRGFSINGTDELFCKESGLWNDQPPTCYVSYCRSLLPPYNGFVSSQKETPVNRTVVFTCKRRYSLVGNAVLRCLDNGRWNNSAPVCKTLCIIPNMSRRSNGIRLIPSLKVLSGGLLMQQGQRVVVNCKRGYTVLSSEISTCIRGVWRPTIQCRKTCTPAKIANGKYVLSKDSSVVNYFCLSGYQLVGQRKLSCMSNMTWDSKAPACSKMCTLPERPNVLAYLNKESYEIIPSETQIVDGAQVYAVCRDNSSSSTDNVVGFSDNSTDIVECVNGTLSHKLCNAKLVKGLLEIYYDGSWCQICETSTDVCSFFGFKAHERGQCSSCCHFDTRAFQQKSQIILSSNDRHRYMDHCMSCRKN